MDYYLKDAGVKGACEFSRLLASTKSDVVLNIEGARNYSPFPFLLTAKSVKDYLAKEGSFQIETDLEDAYDFANKIGFLKATSLSKVAEEDGEYFPITQIDVRKRQREEEQKGEYYDTGDMVEKISKEIAARFTKGEEARLLAYLLREFIRNAPEHGKTHVVDLCLKADREKRTVEFAVADEGIGVMESLISCYAHRQYITENALALRWAIKPGISASFSPAVGQKSRDVWANSGFGLYMISSICCALGGEFYLASQGDCLIKKGDEVEVVKASVKGTVAGGKIVLPEKLNAQATVDAARFAGEKEAKAIKNAFKEASVPSKTLLD